MAVSITVKSPEFLRLEEVFKDMHWKKQKRLVRACYRKATAPTIAAVKSNAPKGRTRNLVSSIGLLFPRDEYSVIIASRTKRGREGWQGWHSHLVESGTVERKWRVTTGTKNYNPAIGGVRLYNRKTGQFYILGLGEYQKTGKMNPNGRYAGFFRRGVKSTGNQAMRIFADTFFKGVEKYHKKHGLK